MKKLAILLVISIIALVGCSMIDQADAEKVVQGIGELVDKGNAINDSLAAEADLQALNQAIDELNNSLEKGKVDQQAVKKVLDQLAKQKAASEKERKGLQEIHNKIPGIKAQIAQLSEERKKLASQALTDLQTLTENELKLKDLEIQMFDLNITYYETIGKGEQPADDHYEQLEAESKKMDSQLEADLKRFNDSWNALHKDVRGEETKKPSGE